MMSTAATTQLVTILLVIGSGPTWNNASADEAIPCASAANAGKPGAKSARRRGSLRPRNMDSGNAMDAGRGLPRQTALPPSIFEINFTYDCRLIRGDIRRR